MLKMVPNGVLRLKRILNVAQRLRLRFSFSSGLVGNHIEHPPIFLGLHVLATNPFREFA
jgi:hypothetical protein